MVVGVVLVRLHDKGAATVAPGQHGVLLIGRDDEVQLVGLIDHIEILLLDV